VVREESQEKNEGEARIVPEDESFSAREKRESGKLF
jgi:hypothetical protein